MSVTIPPSANLRRGRPYVFTGQFLGEHVPGAIITPNRVMCAEDAAWIFASHGMPCVRWPGIPAHGIPWGRALAESMKLFPYQEDGVNFLCLRDYAILADEMGLGKTAQAITAAELRLRFGSGAGPAILILCPAIAKPTWKREIKRWTGHDATILDGLKVESLPTTRYVICNYDILYGQRRRDAAGKLNAREHLPGWGETLAKMRFPIVICDEAHGLRGQKSQRTTAVAQVAEESTCVWLLTGTPMPNHVRDIWALWDLASGGYRPKAGKERDGLAGWFWPWAKAYAGVVKNQYGSTADGSTREEELGKRLSFFCLGRTKASVGLQLPEKRREVATVDVGEVSILRPAGKAQADHVFGGKSGAVESALRQTARAKLPFVVEMVKEAMEARQKVVVFTYLREQCDRIAKEVSNANLGVTIGVSGDQSPEQRDALAGSFRESAAPACLVATIDSVGVAISLIGADLAIFADLSYDPSKLLQAEARCHRIGSVNRLLVRYVIAAGTLDETVADSVVEKLDTIQAAIGGMGDGNELTGHLRRGEVTTTEAIIDRLFAKLTGG